LPKTTTFSLKPFYSPTTLPFNKKLFYHKQKKQSHHKQKTNKKTFLSANNTWFSARKKTINTFK